MKKSKSRSKRNKQKTKLYLTYEDLKLLNDILNYLDEIDKIHIDYPYDQSVYKDFPNKPIQQKIVEENIKEDTFIPIKEEDVLFPFIPIIKEEVHIENKNFIPIKEVQEKKVETITNIIKKIKRTERDNEAINFIDNILSKVPGEKENIILQLKNLFNTKDPKVIKYNLEKYYVIPDYSDTFLLQIIKTDYKKLLKPSDYNNIQNTDSYKSLFNSNKNKLPFITLELYDKNSTYLKKFALLYLIEYDKIYDLTFLNRLIDSIPKLIKELKA